MCNNIYCACRVEGVDEGIVEEFMLIWEFSWTIQEEGAIRSDPWIKARLAELDVRRS